MRHNTELVGTVCMGHGKPGKSQNGRISFSRPGKSHGNNVFVIERHEKNTCSFQQIFNYIIQF